MKQREHMWAIEGRWSRDDKPFLYFGTWPTRRDALAAHTGGKGLPWKKCRARGDRAVKVIVTWDSRP